MKAIRDEFLSEEDLDLRNMTEEELIAYWNLWLQQAQATNERDAHTYSHGVFTHEPPFPSSARAAKKRQRHG
jgi:hypothetical protein